MIKTQWQTVTGRYSDLFDRPSFAETHQPKLNSVILSAESAKVLLNADYSGLEQHVLSQLTPHHFGYIEPKTFEETKMNAVNILLAKNENFKFVSCVFNINQDASLQKHYTYKTLLNVEAGDLVVAPTQQGTFETVRVVEVDTKFEGTANIKWIAAKLDTAHLDECKAMEEEIKQLFVEEEKRKKAESTKAQLEEYLGVEGVSKAELIAKKVRI